MCGLLFYLYVYKNGIIHIFTQQSHRPWGDKGNGRRLSCPLASQILSAQNGWKRKNWKKQLSEVKQ